MTDANYIFLTCSAGMESTVKAEILARYPDLRPAFGRPGLVTFKGGLPPGFHPLTADSWGIGLGLASSPDEIVALTAGLSVRSVWCREREEGFLAEAPAEIPLSKGGTQVVDLIVALEEPTYVGWHPVSQRFPRAFPAPVHAPSRAYRKFVEALQFTRAPFEEGDRVLEFGSAPGGASMAMLERGFSVMGIDPAPMDAAVLAHPKYRHVAEPIGAFQREKFPEKIDWFVIELGIAPAKALRALQRFFPPYKRTLKGAFITLKLNDVTWLRDVPTWQRQLREFGLVDQKWQHLPAHRQEVFVYGKTRNLHRR